MSHYRVQLAEDLARNSRVMREVDGEGDNLPYLIDEAMIIGQQVRVTYSNGDVVKYGREFPVVTVVED